jgi:hypothetical protein
MFKSPARVTCLIGVLAVLVSVAPAQQANGVALVRRAPTLNGTVEGSVHVMTAENITLNGGAIVTGDLLVPGTPAVQLNGSPTYGGTLDGSGNPTPATYTIKLNGGAFLSHVVRRTNAIDLPVVAAPPSPTGTRNVTLAGPSDSPGDFATLKDLTLGNNVGQVVVPPGTYGNFNAGAGSGFTLGLVGATTPAIYNFQSLALNSNSSFQIVGPVVVTVGGDLSANATMGAAAHPEWLKLRLANGSLTVAGQRIVYAQLEAPGGALTLKGGSQFIGTVATDNLVVEGNALLRVMAPPSTNQLPTVILTAPAGGTNYEAPAAFTIQAVATDPDGTVAKVEFYEGTTWLGEDAAAPYDFPVTGLGAGTHTYSALAIDNLGGIGYSAAVSVTVTSPVNQPPTIILTAPVDGPPLTAPATVALAATASDTDGSVARVEFYQDGTKVDEDFTAPYQSTVSNLPAGTYAFSARAFDNQTASAVTPDVTVTVVHPNQAPSVIITAPTDGSIFALPATFTLAATATDNDGTIAKVEFYQNGSLLGEDAAAPFTFPATLTTAGTYNFVARATDNDDSGTDSAPVTVTITENPSAGLPYLAGFEVTEGYTLGSINGQKGWTATSPSVVTNADAAAGTQSALLPDNNPPLILSHAFTSPPGQPVVFVDLFALLHATADVASSAKLITSNAVQVAFVRSGTTGTFHAFNGTGGGGGIWQSAASIPVDTAGYATDWARVTLRIDYTAKKWDLYVGGSLVAVDLGFVENSQAEIGSFSVTGEGSAPTLMDEFLVAFENPVFADTDKDGMDDAWETAHGLNPALNDRNSDLDGDGLTNIREYLLGTNPNSADTDGDGLPDSWEQQHGLNPLLDDSAGDPDGDSVSNLIEFLQGRNPQKGALPDTGGTVNLRVFRPGN